MTEAVTETLTLLNLIAARVSNPETANRPYSAMASLISPSLAITPDHALPPQTKGAHSDQKLELHFERWSTPLSVIATVASRDPALDFAVLKLDSAAPIDLPPTMLSQFDPPPTAKWESLGLIPTAPEGVYITGTVDGIVTLDGRPYLQLRMSPGQSQDWQGMSGAPVLVYGQLVGVMARFDEKESTWFAIPVSAMITSTVTDAIQAALSSTPNASASTTELDEAALFRRLSPSSRQALGHADGMRASLEQDRVHMEHLITGLYEKEDGPTQKLLHQAGLDDAALRDLLAEVVETRLPARNEYSPTLLSALPPLSSHARAALIAARNLVDENGSTVVQSRHLIYGALSVDNCDIIQALQQRGVRKENVKLVDKPGLRIAGFRSDNPDGNDLLGITREVQALCSVLAAKEVEPPLSLGLFGNWGSGKSFFMKQMEDRIEELKEAARHANTNTRYCANIVQLRFNAWHYMDTDLWASLASEIFEGLAQALARQAALTAGEADPEYERARLLDARARSKDVLAEAEQKKAAVEAELRTSEQRLAELERSEISAQTSPQAVLREAYRFAVRQPEVREKIEKAEQDLNTKVEEAAQELNIPADKAARTEMKNQLLELQGFWGRIHAIVLSIRNTKNSKIWLLSVVAVVTIPLVIGWLLPWALNLGWDKTVVRAIGMLAGILGGLTPFYPSAKRALTIIEDAIKSNQELLEETKREKEAELQLQHRQIQQRVADAQQQVEKASADVVLQEEQLEKLRVDRQMSDFIKQRHESTDYTRYLGVIARARSDFEQLSILLAKEKEQAEEEEAQRKKEGKVEEIQNGEMNKGQTVDEKTLLPRIDRIILYIDDLDRCPEEKVIDVLQAIHLLLAFPLFIVVVGVDPRWLLHSLKQRSKVFQTEAIESEGVSEEERAYWGSTPLNYLEKIFQIPFTLRPMERAGFRELVDSLTMQQDRMAGKKTVRTSQLGKKKEVLPPIVPATEVSVMAQEPTPTASDNGAPTVSPTSGIPDATVSLPTSTTPSTLPSTSSPTTTPAVTTPGADPPAQPAIDLNPDHLRIEEWERESMKELFRLIPSPRAAKRFVNIYRLVRASVDENQHEVFVGDETQGQYRAVLLLLAILIGYPAEATKILHELLEREHSEMWWEFIKGFEKLAKKADAPNENYDTVSDVSGAEAERWQELLKQLDKIRSFIPENQSCEDFRLWAREVARYSFQSGRVLLAQRVAGAGD